MLNVKKCMCWYLSIIVSLVVSCFYNNGEETSQGNSTNQGTASITKDGAHSTFVAIWVGLIPESRSQWPSGLRPRSAAARLQGLSVRIPPGAWISVSCGCCVLSGRGLCVVLITSLYNLCLLTTKPSYQRTCHREHSVEVVSLSLSLSLSLTHTHTHTRALFDAIDHNQRHL